MNQKPNEELVELTTAMKGRYPGPRLREQGNGSGAEFLEDHVLPAVRRAIKTKGRATVSVAGTTYGCPGGFLEECFGGLVRHVGIETARRHMRIVDDEATPAEEIDEIMRRAAALQNYGSQYKSLLGISPVPPEELLATLVFASDADTAREWISRQHDSDKTAHLETAEYRHILWLDTSSGNPTAAIKLPDGSTLVVGRSETQELRTSINRHCTRNAVIRGHWAKKPHEPIDEVDQQLRLDLVTDGDHRIELTVAATRNRDQTGLESRAHRRSDQPALDLVEIRLNTESRKVLNTIAACSIGDAIHGSWPRLVSHTSSDDADANKDTRARLAQWTRRIRQWMALWRHLPTGNAETDTADNDQVDAELRELGMKRSRTDDGKPCIEGDHQVLGKYRWRTRAEIEEAVDHELRKLSIRTPVWERPERGYLEPGELRIVLVGDTAHEDGIDITARYQAGVARYARLTDRTGPNETVEWTRVAGNEQDKATANALHWLAHRAAQRIREARTGSGAKPDW